MGETARSRMAEQNVERRLMAADEEEHSLERGRSQRSVMEGVPITQSARSEVVRQGAERLASLLTLSDQPMLAWRLDGYIEFWNSGAERLYGFAPEISGPASCSTFARTAVKSL